MTDRANAAGDASSPGFRRGLLANQRKAPGGSPGTCLRRAFFADMGLGFTGLALGAMLHRDAIASGGVSTPPDGRPHFPPRAKSVIWLFMNGGVSHMES